MGIEGSESSGDLSAFGILSFFMRRVIVRCAPKETLTMLELLTTSIVLSECSDILSLPLR